MKMPTLVRCSTASAASTAVSSTLTSAAGRLVWRIALRFPCSGRSHATIAEHCSKVRLPRSTLGQMSTSHESRPVSQAERGSSWPRRVMLKAEGLVANPLFSYSAIVVLQLRVIWKVWEYKDVTSGDTSGYFLDAVTWANDLRDDIIWSPLYTNFFGSFVAVFGDVPSAVMAHRIAIVLISALLVLALMRSLLGPALGLLVAVWWALLPTNFNVEYEVHLFGLLPILVAAVVVSRVQSRAALGGAFAILVGSTLLLRNELVIVTAVLAVAIAVRELHARRATPSRPRAFVGAYGLPLLIVCLLVGGAYWRSFEQGDQAL